MNLSDNFPEEFKNEFAASKIKQGSVLKVYVPDTFPPKIKYIVVVGIENDKILFSTIFINTDINVNILNTPELIALQYELSEIYCEFLQHKSYADCSVVVERNHDEYVQKILNNPNLYCGDLNNEQIKGVMKLIKSSRKIPIKLKKKYSFFNA